MKIRVLHLGVGKVGRTVQELTYKFAPELLYCGLFTSKRGIYESGGLSQSQLEAFGAGGDGSASCADAISKISLPFILVDSTATEETRSLLELALSRGGAVVMSNKKPISGTQADFDTLVRLGGKRLFYETTVGAALPVVETVASLIQTGDEIVQIQGCLSGTLGFIFSAIEAGASFSEAVTDASDQGFTEPDPRDDLSGVDVARKVLILSRVMGRRLELNDVKLTGLFPARMSSTDKPAFMADLASLDAEYLRKQSDAARHRKVLRYVATSTADSSRVGLEEVSAQSEIGQLHGPNNVVVIQTRRYFDNPLIIKGPGAGIDVTAAGVLADMLKAAEVLGR